MSRLTYRPPNYIHGSPVVNNNNSEVSVCAIIHRPDASSTISNKVLSILPCDHTGEKACGENKNKTENAV